MLVAIDVEAYEKDTTTVTEVGLALIMLDEANIYLWEGKEKILTRHWVVDEHYSL